MSTLMFERDEMRKTGSHFSSSRMRRTPLHRALHRPNLILGAERELVLITAILCGGVAVSGLNIVSGSIGVSVWLVTLAFLQMMAKTDPHLSKVYLRYLRYRPFYPARSRPSCTE